MRLLYNSNRVWAYIPSSMNKLINENRIYFPEDTSKRPMIKRFRKELKGAHNPFSSLMSEVGLNTEATKQIQQIMDGNIFEYSKPLSLVKTISKQATGEKEDVILDFFSGSCTTAQAVLDLNKEDGGNRKFICVQLPEKCDEKSEAFKAGYKTIADIGKERIRRVIKKIRKDQDGRLDLNGIISKQDLGFKAFKLRQSNFKIWSSKIEDEEQLVKQLQKHLEPLDEHAKTENVLYELLLKSGNPLTSKIIRKNGYFLVNDNELSLILEKINEKIIKNVITTKPEKVITLDRLFNNNDRLKTNTALQMKDAEIEFKSI